MQGPHHHPGAAPALGFADGRPELEPSQVRDFRSADPLAIRSLELRRTLQRGPWVEAAPNVQGGPYPVPSWTPWVPTRLSPDIGGDRFGPRVICWQGAGGGAFPFARIMLSAPHDAPVRLGLVDPALGTGTVVKTADVRDGGIDIVIPSRGVLIASGMFLAQPQQVFCSSTYVSEDQRREGIVQDFETIPGLGAIELFPPPQGALETFVQTSGAGTLELRDDPSGAALMTTIPLGPLVNGGAPVPIGPLTRTTLLAFSAPAGAGINISVQYRVEL